MNAESPVVLMGVAGAGKTTVGERVAQRLGRDFIDADLYHSIEARESMLVGMPLSDEDRVEWLDSVGAAVQHAGERGRSVVLACSALGEAHRTQLKTWIPDARFFWLDVPVETLRQRLGERRGHFAGPTLLDSQLATLEPPNGTAIRIDASAPMEKVVQAVLRHV